MPTKENRYIDTPSKIIEGKRKRTDKNPFKFSEKHNKDMETAREASKYWRGKMQSDALDAEPSAKRLRADPSAEMSDVDAMLWNAATFYSVDHPKYPHNLQKWIRLDELDEKLLNSIELKKLEDCVNDYHDQKLRVPHFSNHFEDRV